MLILLDVACVAFLLALILTPFVRDGAIRFGITDRPDGARKLHQQPTPRLGGVAVMLAYVFACAFLLVAPYRGLTIDIPQALDGGLRLLPALLLVFLTGLLDDIVGLRPWQKFVGQIAAAGAAYAAGFGVYVFRGHPLGEWASVAATVFWLVGCSNAFNLIDGLDGLAAGVGTFAALTTLVAALVHGHIELAIVTAPLVGSLLGFLRYNFNPASIFLGDSGSLCIGFLLGCYGAVWGQKSATLLGMTAPLMALAVPLLDTGLAIVRRFLRNQPIFGADRGHIHHRLLDQGLTVRKVALLLYASCGVGAALSLLQDFGAQHVGGLIVVLFCAVTWIGIQHLGYSEFAVAGKLLFRGTLRTMVDTQVRLAAFSRAVQAAQTPDEVGAALFKTAREFGFSSVRFQFPGVTVTNARFSEPAEGVTEWELRIHLPAGYIQLTHPAVLSGQGPNLGVFACGVQQTLQDWTRNEPEKGITAVANS